MRKTSRYVSKTPAFKDDVFECGLTASAVQFGNSKKAIIEYIHREGMKEPILMADALETGVIPTIMVRPMPPRIEDPDNRVNMIDDQAEVFMWQSVLKQVPVHRVNLQEGLVTTFTTYLDQCLLTVHGKLDQLFDWPKIKQDKDPICLKNKNQNHHKLVQK